MRFAAGGDGRRDGVSFVSYCSQKPSPLRMEELSDLKTYRALAMQKFRQGDTLLQKACKFQGPGAAVRTEEGGGWG